MGLSFRSVRRSSRPLKVRRAGTRRSNQPTPVLPLHRKGPMRGLDSTAAVVTREGPRSGRQDNTVRASTAARNGPGRNPKLRRGCGTDAPEAHEQARATISTCRRRKSPQLTGHSVRTGACRPPPLRQRIGSVRSNHARRDAGRREDRSQSQAPGPVPGAPRSSDNVPFQAGSLRNEDCRSQVSGIKVQLLVRVWEEAPAAFAAISKKRPARSRPGHRIFLHNARASWASFSRPHTPIPECMA